MRFLPFNFSIGLLLGIRLWCIIIRIGFVIDKFDG